MSLDLISDIWSELKLYVSALDRREAADTMVSILIDNDYTIDEIQSAFKGDSDVKKSCQSYSNGDEEEIEEDVDYDDENWDD